jgi:hypothetical protein
MQKIAPPSSAQSRVNTGWQYSRPFLIRGLLVLLLCALPPFTTQAQKDEAKDQDKSAEAVPPYRISGTVTNVRVFEDERAVKVRFSVNLVAENTSHEDLILLRRAPAVNTEYLFTSPNANEPLWVLAHPAPVTTVARPEKWETVRSGMDQKEPAEDFTIILNPGDTIGWDLPLELTFFKTAEPRDVQVGTPPRPVWNVVQKSCPCWLRLDLDFWPADLEPKRDPENPALARKLSARWKKKGTLIYTEKRSEAMALTLGQSAH